jgi:DNA repair and recombination protein RAD54B
MRGRVRAVRPFQEARRVLLSGTPVSESPSNAFPVLRFLAPERVPSKTRFDNHFIIRAPVQAGPVTVQKAISYSNLDELKRMLEQHSVRRLKADIRGMPDRVEVVRYCQPTPTQANHYREILAGILAEMSSMAVHDWAATIDIACVRLLRLRQVLNHPEILGLDGRSGKHDELEGVVEEVLSNPEAKLVIWTEWNKAVDLLARRFDQYGCITIDQRTTQDQLARYERTFDQSDERVAIATPAKGGTGIDFLARARTAIYVERTYSLVNHRQSIDRIVRRVGEDDPADSPAVQQVKRLKRSPATIVYLHVPGTVDDAVAWVLQRKLDLSDALLTSDERLMQDGRQHLIQMLQSGMHL